ncbi:hypothetical protein D3C85_1737690 [compost metagenome]
MFVFVAHRQMPAIGIGIPALHIGDPGAIRQLSGIAFEIGVGLPDPVHLRIAADIRGLAPTIDIARAGLVAGFQPPVVQPHMGQYLRLA